MREQVSAGGEQVNTHQEQVNANLAEVGAYLYLRRACAEAPTLGWNTPGHNRQYVEIDSNILKSLLTRRFLLSQRIRK